MYLTSKFFKSRYRTPLIILFFVLFYLVANKSFRAIFVSFSSNLFLSRNSYVKEVEELKKQNVMLTLKINKLQFLEEENRALRQIIQFKEDRSIELLPLRVLSVEPSSFRRVVLLDGGKDRGIAEGMYAISTQGHLIGKILSVEKNYSQLILLNDPDFNATVSVSGHLGLLKGTLAGEVKVFYIETTDMVKAGDLVFTASQVSGVNIAVGKVKKIGHDKNSLFLDLTVEAFASTDHYNLVFAVQ